MAKKKEAKQKLEKKSAAENSLMNIGKSDIV